MHFDIYFDLFPFSLFGSHFAFTRQVIGNWNCYYLFKLILTQSLNQHGIGFLIELSYEFGLFR